MPLRPLPIGQRAGRTGQLDVRLHEAQADVQVGVLLLYGHHLATVIRIEQALGLHDHAIGEDEVRCVDGFDLVGQGPAFVVEGQAPLVEGQRNGCLKL